jgi:hypothetical protein
LYYVKREKGVVWSLKRSQESVKEVHPQSREVDNGHKTDIDHAVSHHVPH